MFKIPRRVEREEKKRDIMEGRVWKAEYALGLDLAPKKFLIPDSRITRTSEETQPVASEVQWKKAPRVAYKSGKILFTTENKRALSITASGDLIKKVLYPADIAAKESGMGYLTPLAFYIYFSREVTPKKAVLCIDIGKRFVTVATSDKELEDSCYESREVTPKKAVLCIDIGKRYVTVSTSDKELEDSCYESHLSKRDAAASVNKFEKLISEKDIGGIVVGSLLDDFSCPLGRENDEKLDCEAGEVLRGLFATKVFSNMKYTYWTNAAAHTLSEHQQLTSTEGFIPVEIKQLQETPETTVACVTLDDYLEYMAYKKQKGKLPNEKSDEIF